MKTRRKKLKPQKPAPGYEGRFAVGTTDVPDPYEPHKSLKVAVNVRHDPLIHWKARSQIDEAEYHAGRKFQAIFAKAEIGGPAAIDYTKPLVDGGYPVDPLTDDVVQAGNTLLELRVVLGYTDYLLLVRVLCLGKPIQEEALAWGGKEPERYIARRVRDGLASLAGHWGTTARDRSTIRVLRA